MFATCVTACPARRAGAPRRCRAVGPPGPVASVPRRRGYAPHATWRPRIRPRSSSSYSDRIAEMISNQHHFAQPHSKRRHTVASGHRQRIVLAGHPDERLRRLDDDMVAGRRGTGVLRALSMAASASETERSCTHAHWASLTSRSPSALIEVRYRLGPPAVCAPKPRFCATARRPKSSSTQAATKNPADHC
jgi:hypothetical protein